MPETEVASAFVTIGAKTEKLKTAFRDSEQITRASLARMGRGIGDFAARFGGKLGIGLGVGLAAGAAVAVKAGVSIEGSLATLGQRAGELGVSFSKQLAIVQEFFTVWRKLTPITREQALAMGSLGLQYGHAGDRLKGLLEASAGAAEGFGKPIEAMQAGLAALTRGGDLLGFGIRTTGPTSEDVFRDFLATGARRAAAARERGGLRPGAQLEAVRARLTDAAGATGGILFDLAEAVGQTASIAGGLIPESVKAAARNPNTEFNRFRRDQTTGRGERRALEKQFGFEQPLFLDKMADRIGRFFGGDLVDLTRSEQRAEREAGFFDQRVGGETGVSGGERALRGTGAGGDGGTEAEELSSAMRTLKTAVENNTKALGPDSPRLMEQP